MKKNLVVLIGGALILASVSAYSLLSPDPTLHAGIGGTWSADMKTGAGVANAKIEGKEFDSLKELVRSGNLSSEQQQDIQAQLMAHAIKLKFNKESEIRIEDVESALKSMENEGLIQFK